MPPLRLIFAGTPDFAAQHLETLLQTDHQICAVYTQPDRPAGRGRKLTASPVKQLAIAHDIPVEQPQSLRDDDAQATLKAYQADLMIVVAYGLLLPQTVLDTPRLGCVNMHASLLPRWRGAAPIQRAIEAGDNETGVCLMQMAAGLDTGPVLALSRTAITPSDTAQTLHDRLAELGADLLAQSLDNIESLQQHATQQNAAQSTYARKLDKAEALIDWHRPAAEIDRQVRAFNPWPMAYTTCDGQRLRILQTAVTSVSPPASPGTVTSLGKDFFEIACGEDAVLVYTLQPAGKRAMSAADYLNAAALKQGDRLG